MFYSVNCQDCKAVVSETKSLKWARNQRAFNRILLPALALYVIGLWGALGFTSSRWGGFLGPGAAGLFLFFLLFLATRRSISKARLVRLANGSGADWHLTLRQVRDQDDRSAIIQPVTLIGKDAPILPIWIELRMVEGDCRPVLRSTVELEQRIQAWEVSTNKPLGPYTFIDWNGWSEVVLPENSDRMLEIFGLIQNGRTFGTERTQNVAMDSLRLAELTRAYTALLTLQYYLERTKPRAHGSVMNEVRRIVRSLVETTCQDQEILRAAKEKTFLDYLQHELHLEYHRPEPKNVSEPTAPSTVTS